MTKHLNFSRIIVLSLLVVLAASTRAIPLLIPHLWNFTAVGALAIFAGAQFKDKWLAFLIPLAVMALSDLFIGYGFNTSVYIGFVLMVLCGFLIRKNVTVANVGLASIGGALIFFLITNFAYLYPETLYPHNFSGIIQSYIMGLPFLQNMLIGDAIYGTVLFYGFHLLVKKYPALAVAK
ncbi:DUF6580 family putative transport protein [Rubrolithibacter danxiaensis]|uniref:DUF6580 family putative transport protein n=1 Tax=Rubrolithibacter danxiaensis TaxID=3390805 RepID=UPI003BF8E044